jgi:hypothetical protein
VNGLTATYPPRSKPLTRPGSLTDGTLISLFRPTLARRGLDVVRGFATAYQPRGRSAWQSSQPVETQAASVTGTHPSKLGVAGSSPAGRALSLASVVQSCAPQSIGTAMSAFANGGLLIAAAVAGGIAWISTNVSSRAGHKSLAFHIVSGRSSTPSASGWTNRPALVPVVCSTLRDGKRDREAT